MTTDSQLTDSDQTTQEQGPLSDVLSRLRSSEPELAYFSLERLSPLAANPAFDLTWSAIAHAGFRAFAAKLLGFRDSSSPYLWDNFLGGFGQAYIGRGRIDVRLPFSPLRMMLRLTGFGAMTYTVPWLTDTEISVRMPDE